MNDNVFPLDAHRRSRNAIRDQLKADASRLRNEAFAEVLVGAHGFVRDAAHRAARAANRLAARLRQHARQRAFEA